ncbi:hypothetical protein [Nonomuraea sediminis]|uniref:hypothetical protein n=1 Tax=Nonomuraea sediminis TaxID=2835864 RepID=UPI001BDC68F6|nr:hypothetical protein [Nonomuraea sediminis]
MTHRASADYNPGRRWLIYGCTALLILIGLLIMLIMWGTHKANATFRAEQKAKELQSALQAAGLPVPQEDQIVRVLGEDGGPVCASPNAALAYGLLRAGLVNGAAGPGVRPIIAHPNVVKAEQLVLQVYCPDEAQKFAQFVSTLKLEG